jgi:hypothetical protein
MERSGMRGSQRGLQLPYPDFAALHPGYKTVLF